MRWKRNCGSDNEEEVAPGQEKDLEEDPDGDMEEEHECSDAQEVFDKWMLSLTQNHRKMLSVVLFESFCTRQGMSKMNAAQEVASISLQRRSPSRHGS